MQASTNENWGRNSAKWRCSSIIQTLPYITWLHNGPMKSNRMQKTASGICTYLEQSLPSNSNREFRIVAVASFPSARKIGALGNQAKVAAADDAGTVSFPQMTAGLRGCAYYWQRLTFVTVSLVRTLSAQLSVACSCAGRAWERLMWDGTFAKLTTHENAWLQLN